MRGRAFAVLAFLAAVIGSSGCAVGAEPAATGQGIAYRVHGWNFGPFIDGQDPNAGSVVGATQVRERLRLVSGHAEWVRGFGSTGGIEHVGRIGRELGLRTACGAWLGRNAAANDAEIEGLIASGRAGDCDLLIVGSETILRGDLTPAQLLGYITRVKRAVPGVPVSTADVHSVITSAAVRPILDTIDVVLVNYYPFWEGIALEDAIGALRQWHERVLQAAGGREVIVSETGWPSCGGRRGEAEGSAQNAAEYFFRFVSWARANRVRYFYFAALDESWKARYEGAWGACWGVFDRSGQLKPGMQRVFDGETTADGARQP